MILLKTQEMIRQLGEDLDVLLKLIKAEINNGFKIIYKSKILLKNLKGRYLSLAVL
jgi:hypothetical protein